MCAKRDSGIFNMLFNNQEALIPQIPSEVATLKYHLVKFNLMKVYRNNLCGDIFIIILCYKQCSQKFRIITHVVFVTTVLGKIQVVI